SELDSMVVCYNILCIAFEDTDYKISLGEQASTETKKSRLHNKRLYGSDGSFAAVHNIIGRKIDALVTIEKIEISCCEWKAPNVTTTVIHEQQRLFMSKFELSTI
ncbi:hypothetical protein BDC45DRAFT_442175, partial [Circinella umbellata]